MNRKFICILCCAVLGIMYVSVSRLDAQNNNEVDEVAAKKREKKKWDILNPPFKLSTIQIDTDETTWSSLDITPDGKRFVFDMLGDLYIVDINGGQATPLTQDFAWNIQPAVSPDGSKIAFISDRDGLSNLWIMNIDGSNLKQISKETKNLIHSPKWSPSGQYIVVTKGIMSSRSIPAGEIWVYHHGGGSGGLLIKKRASGKKEQKNIADPSFSPDSKYIYYTKDITPGFTFSYNRDPLKSIFAIMRYDMRKGEEERFITGTGGAIVPTPSPDNKFIAFIRRVKNKTALFIKHLETGIEEPVFLDLERDMQEGFGTEGYFAYFDWTPDSKAIVFWTGGKFHKLSLADKSVKPIPVRVKAKVKYAEAVRFDVDVAPDNFSVKMVRWAQKSPNGKSILFQALGKLYVKDIESGKITRLTNQNDHDEFYPRYSNDGKTIVYTTWHDKKLGDIKVVSANGGEGKSVAKAPGHYIEPSFSTDDKLITYRKFTGGFLLNPKYSVEPGIYVTDLKTNKHIRVSKSGTNPHFAGDNKRVYFTKSVPKKAYPERQLVSVALNGKDLRKHLYGADKVGEFRLSHDKNWIAFTYQYNAYVAPFTETGKRVEIGPKSTSFPIKKVSSKAGEFLNWHTDNKTISWNHGATYYERKVKNTFDFVSGAPQNLPDPVSSGISLSFVQKSDKPIGYKAFVGGSIITMRDAQNQQEVIQNGTILIKDNKIVRVGKVDEVRVPKGALVIDVKGKTIIPGLVDAHAHGAQGRNEIIPRQNWIMYSNLAFGVTTIHDPSNDTTEIFSASEMQRAGKIVAPRIYSTGTILYGAELLGYKAIVNSYEDALFHVRRMKDVGAISVKSYNQPSRAQRQQILAAARKLGMMVVPEGGGKLQQNITMLVDGHTGLEHSLPIARGYKDLTDLWASTKFGYTPTFVVSYGGLSGELYWYDNMDVWKNKRLTRYTPDFILDRRAIRRPKAPDNQYNHFEVAKYAKTLIDKGVGVHIGAHGQREGLGAHWELWIMNQGGFSPWQALRAGTIDGARHLGMDKQIGSIEPGKLADIVVIDGNVLKDLRRSEFVKYTVLNGRVYEAATMNEVGGRVKRYPFFFESKKESFMPDQTQKSIEKKARVYNWIH